MPNRKAHNYFARLLGVDPKLANAVNRDIDAPSKWLGPSHRKVRHDAGYALELAVRNGDPQAFLAAEAHYALDRIASSSPELRRAFAMMEALLP